MPARHKIPVRIRTQVAERAAGCCEYCRAPEAFSLDSLSVDHVQPIAEMGADTLDNLAFACLNCDTRKGDATLVRDPETGEVVPLFHPRHDEWNEHFAWSDDGLMILALSAIGRATILRLHLNRQGAVNIRRALIALGERRG